MEKILVTQSETACPPLDALLQAEGFVVVRARRVEDALGRLAQGAALWLLEAEQLAAADAEFRQLVNRRCCELEVFCLLFSSGGMSVEAMAKLAPWAAAITLPATDGGLVLGRVRDQLSIRRLAYERNLAQARLLEKQEEYRINLESASSIQNSLLPQRLPNIGGLRFASRFIPCDKVGGDIYNVLQIDEDTLMLYLLDVSGHGVSSAMITVSVFQSLSLQTGQIVKQRCAVPPYYRIPSPAEVLASLDREFPFERFEKFFTITYLLLNIHTGQLRYSSAGHPAPLLIGSSGEWQLLAEGGAIIGVDGANPYDEGEVMLQPGDRLYLYSDGVTEHMNENGELFGVERLVRRLGEQRRRPLDSACGKLVEGLQDFGHNGRFRDDVTLFACEFGENG